MSSSSQRVQVQWHPFVPALSLAWNMPDNRRHFLQVVRNLKKLVDTKHFSLEYSLQMKQKREYSVLLIPALALHEIRLQAGRIGFDPS
jgi:hypothetical protein